MRMILTDIIVKAECVHNCFGLGVILKKYLWCLLVVLIEEGGDEGRETRKHVRCDVIDYVGTITEPQPTSLSHKSVHPSSLSYSLITLMDLANGEHFDFSTTGGTRSNMSDVCIPFGCSSSRAQVLRLVSWLGLLRQWDGQYYSIPGLRSTACQSSTSVWFQLVRLPPEFLSH